MVSLHHVRRLIKAVEISEAWSTQNKIFIDFFDRHGRARWYLLYSVEFRTFKVNKLDNKGQGLTVHGSPDKLKRYLIELTPPEIIAHCTAASLGVGQTIDLMVKRDPPPWG